MRVAHELAVDVQHELQDRAVHLHGFELELDARRPAPASEEDVADDLSALELGQRGRRPQDRISEPPRDLTGIDVRRQGLLKEAIEHAVR